MPLLYVTYTSFGFPKAEAKLRLPKLRLHKKAPKRNVKSQIHQTE